MHTLVEATEAFARQTLQHTDPGHDWSHIDRVRKLALRIAHEEGADPLVVELGALLHDIADHKFHGGDYEKGANVSRTFLASQGVDLVIIDHVCDIVRSVSFSKGKIPSTTEGKCVQDADRLDTLGAIGIARTFAYTGHMQRPLYIPGEEERTRANTQHSGVAHFYEKLLHLKDRMNTATAKKMAQERHKFIEFYLQQFIDEWNGKK